MALRSNKSCTLAIPFWALSMLKLPLRETLQLGEIRIDANTGYKNKERHNLF